MLALVVAQERVERPASLLLDELRFERLAEHRRHVEVARLFFTRAWSASGR